MQARKAVVVVQLAASRCDERWARDVGLRLQVHCSGPATPHLNLYGPTLVNALIYLFITIECLNVIRREIHNEYAVDRSTPRRHDIGERVRGGGNSLVAHQARRQPFARVAVAEHLVQALWIDQAAVGEDMLRG